MRMLTISFTLVDLSVTLFKPTIYSRPCCVLGNYSGQILSCVELIDLFTPYTCICVKYANIIA